VDAIYDDGMRTSSGFIGRRGSLPSRFARKTEDAQAIVRYLGLGDEIQSQSRGYAEAIHVHRFARFRGSWASVKLGGTRLRDTDK
jgi:hypothetical protein